MTHWVDTIRADSCDEGTIIEHIVEGQILAIANYQNQYYVLDGICPHQGGSIGKGTLHGCQPCLIRCPWHGWEYDLATGQHQSIPSVLLPTFETRVHDGILQVRIDA